MELDKKMSKAEILNAMRRMGILNVGSDMTTKELKKIYADWKESEAARIKGEEDAKRMAEESTKETEKRKVVVTKKGITVPEDLRKILPSDIAVRKVMGDVMVVIFKDGPKARYNIKTYQRIV